MKSLAESGMTICIVTHEMAFAKEISTRVLFVDQKSILADGSVDEHVQTTNGAIRGNLGNKLKKEWEDNCSILLNFDAYFDDLTRRAVEVYNSKSTTTDDVVAELSTTPEVESVPTAELVGAGGEGGE